MSNKSAKLRYQKTYKGIRIDIIASTEDELEEKVRKKKNAIDDGETFGSNMLVRVWADKWLTTYKLNVVSNNNYRQYETNLRLHILPLIGNKRLTDVKQYDLQAVLNGCKQYSRSHQVHIKNAITGMFRSAFQNGLIHTDPSANLKVANKSAVYDTGESGHRSLTDAEAEQMLRHADEHYAGILFKIAYYCGLRPEEICALSADSFVLTQGRESINVKYAIERRTRIVKTPKTKSSVRAVPIPAVLVPDVKKLVKENKGKRFIFTTADGRPMDTDDVCRWWRFFRNHIDRAEGAKTYNSKIIEHAFADDLTPYDLRHTFCTNLQRAGVPINVAKVLMGHSSIEVTAKIYTHHTEDMTDDARAKMSKFAGFNAENNV